MGHTSLYKASAPGSLFLMGEHAVLHAELALVAALNHRITITLVPRQDNLISISSHLGCFKTSVTTLEKQSPFQWVMAAIEQRKSALSLGFELWIHSEFSEKVGFGSSAAVVVATLGVLDAFLGKGTTSTQADSQSDSRAEIVQAALAAVRQVQGMGSGADVAASVYGGVVCYRQNPLHIEKINFLPPLVAIYSGAKMKTPDVLKHVEKNWAQNPELQSLLYYAMGNASAEAKKALQSGDWPLLGHLMNTQQGLLSALGVSDINLDTLVHRLRADEQIFGAKISGAGLGDCVIGLGKLSQPLEGCLPISISAQGLRYE